MYVILHLIRFQNPFCGINLHTEGLKKFLLYVNNIKKDI